MALDETHTKETIMERTRVKIELAVDLDPVPGTFHTKESAEEQIQAILLSMIPHYNPVVFNTK